MKRFSSLLPDMEIGHSRVEGVAKRLLAKSLRCLLFLQLKQLSFVYELLKSAELILPYGPCFLSFFIGNRQALRKDKYVYLFTFFIGSHPFYQIMLQT